MSMSVPGNSCGSCRTSTSTSSCLMRLQGECVYYSGSNLSGPGINTGDNLNIVVNKLANSSSGGSVTSVAATIPLGAILIAGSPITTSGTLAFTYTGTDSQYVRGDGTLATFPTYTSDNGLTKTLNNTQLGGTLLHNTSISTGAFFLDINTSTSGVNPLSVNSTDGLALSVISASGVGIETTGLVGLVANSSGNSGITINASSGATSLKSFGDGGTNTHIQSTYTSTAAVETMMEIIRSTSGTAADGIGSRLMFELETDADLYAESNSLISKWTDATHATRGSQFEIWGVDSTNLQQQLTIKGTGQHQFNTYGVGTFTGTATYSLQVDSSGNVIEGSLVTGNSFDNGITETSGNVQLGGTLLHDTVIDATTDYSLSVVGQGAGIPLKVNSANNISAQFTSQSSIAVQATSGDSFPAGHFTNSTPYVDSVIDAMHVQHQANGSAPILGIGVGMSMNVSDDSGLYQATRLFSRWTDLTHATRTSEFIISGVSNGTTSDLSTLTGDGSLKLNKYGLGTFTGTAAYTLQVDSSGNVIEGTSSGSASTNIFEDPNFVPLLVFIGESNAVGDGDNFQAAPSELDADPLVQLMQPSGSFATLDIGAGNNLSATDRHGWELELQNQIPTQFAGRTVYVVKAGVGGSSINQWAFGTTNYNNLISRIDDAMSELNDLGLTPAICVWYSQGINDGVSGTDPDVWRDSTLELFHNVRERYGSFPILMTQLIGDRITYPNLDALDLKIVEIADNLDNYVYRIATPQGPIGSGPTDNINPGGIHWSYAGLKIITADMIDVMMNDAGFLYYHHGIKNVTDNTWRLDGNRNTNVATDFIGTNDSTALIFKTNGTEAFRVLADQKIAIGKTTIGAAGVLVDFDGDILVNGLYAGRGGGNEASNIAFGANALVSNTIGSVNAAIGGLALQNNTTGFGNVGLGYQTLNNNSVGNVNVAIGFQAGIQITGSANIAIGNQVGGTWFTSQTNKLAIHNGSTGALIYGDMATGQVQINAAATPTLTASAALEVISTTRGFLPPKMTTTQRDAISSPVAGLMIYNTTTNKLNVYTTAWEEITSA